MHPADSKVVSLPSDPEFYCVTHHALYTRYTTYKAYTMYKTYSACTVYTTYTSYTTCGAYIAYITRAVGEGVSVASIHNRHDARDAAPGYGGVKGEVC